ncbi:MAG TPA: FAD-binding dehydrogenase [Gammaproteobacteria bacterium]|nr:FAD-binding dehydrogenase [Gammaproteobacteria bacterium]
MQNSDLIVIGAGLAGLVAATEATSSGKRVLMLDQESEQSLGGQAFWSFGGLFFVDSPEQRRMGVRDSRELAWADWQGTAGFDRAEDHWPRLWAERYIDFAAGEKRAWLHALGMRWFPIVGWAERGGAGASGRGNSVPRFHVTWGTGLGVVGPFVQRARDAEARGQLEFAFRHRADELVVDNGRVTGVRGTRLAPDSAARGMPSSRDPAGDFELHAPAVIVASGGIGGNHELVRRYWPERLGTPPEQMLTGVPAHVDGRMLGISETAGARFINRDRMWHYVEGIENFNPIWPQHAIRILPGPSSLWLDATGKRLPPPLWPGFDTLGTLAYLRTTGHDYSWFILNQSIIRREFALSGSEQNPDLTGKQWRKVIGRAFGKCAPAPVEAFKRHGRDFIVHDNLCDLVAGMNELAGNDLLNSDRIRAEIEARDRQFDNPFAKDGQIMAIHNARRYRGDRWIRAAKPHRLLDPAHGPLIAVRLHILTRKSLGGLETDLSGRVLRAGGEALPGLYAAGEAAGFGGGGMHGYASLEGTFLGGCLFSGREAGRGAIADIG